MWMATVGLAALLSVGPGTALGLPVGSLAEVARGAVGSRQPGQCAGEPVFVAVVEVRTAAYDFMTDGTQFILADRAEGDDSDVWGGVVEAGGQLRAVDHLPYREWVERFTADVCRYFGRVA